MYYYYYTTVTNNIIDRDEIYIKNTYYIEFDSEQIRYARWASRCYHYLRILF